MGLFGNRKKKNDNELNKVDVPHVEYSSFEQAMIEAVSIGSKDVKIVTVKFDDDEVLDFTISSGEIKYATDFNDNKILARFQWADNDRFSKEYIVKAQEILSTNSFLQQLLV